MRSCRRRTATSRARSTAEPACAFFKLMCATSLGKICASDHAMNAVDEMSALNQDLKAFFEENGAAYPAWRELEQEAGRYLM